jgi:hypothetical protein
MSENAVMEKSGFRRMSKVEALARAYCEELGYDPDGKKHMGPWGPSIPRWALYADKAEAALSNDAMTRALQRTGVEVK